MRFDVLTLFPGDFRRLPGSEPAEEGDRRGAGRGRSCTTSATGRRTSITRWTIGPSAAGRAWCCRSSRWSSASRRCSSDGGRPSAGTSGRAVAPQGRTLNQTGRGGAGRPSRGCCCCAAGTKGSTSGCSTSCSPTRFRSAITSQRRRSGGDGGHRRGDPPGPRRAGRRREQPARFVLRRATGCWSSPSTRGRASSAATQCPRSC